MPEKEEKSAKKTEAGEAAEEDRGQWGNHVEFMLACLGYAVGLGNVWRFPYLCYENGGGAFLIPYFISLVIAGLPVFFLELALGQFSSLGPGSIYGKLAPLFRGLGWGMILVSFIVMLYYNIIIAWVLFYFFASFRKEVMWKNCRNDWNTAICQSNLEKKYCETQLNDSLAIFFDKNCFSQDKNPEEFFRANSSIAAMLLNQTTRGPADEYLHRYVLEISDSFENMGGVSWKLALSLLGAWILIFLCLYKGVQSTGKVVYFTATFPYFVLLILMIRGATLPGAQKGIEFYIIPKFHRLKDIQVWKAAATQIFYSLGPSFGGLITMSSYNPFRNNCLRDSIMVAVGNCATSVFAGFAVFSVIGFMSTDLNIPIQNVTEQGPGLAFIVYPEAISRMPVSPLWAILFFFMLVTLGMDSQFAMCETVTTAIFDEFVSLRRYKTQIIGLVCLISWLLGLPLCARGGFYLFTIIDSYAAGYSLILLCILEIVLTMHVYGIKNVLRDIEMMLGKKPNWYWRVTWFALTPLFLLFIFIFSFVDYKVPKYRSYTFKPGGEALGFVISFASIAVVILFALYSIYRYVFKEKRGWRYLITATPEWCPADVRDHRAKKAQEASNSVEISTISDGKKLNSIYPSPTPGPPAQFG